MMEFRSIVEIESVRLATMRATPAELEELQNIFDNMLAHKHDIAAFSHYDFEFHKFIAGMTKNVVLIKCYSIIWDFIRVYFNKIVRKIGVEKGSYYHGLILEAMKEGNADNARQIMRMHLEDTNKAFFSEPS
jgi:GntR family transcriptional repressor for pyruvate dehydrogenase complex